MPDLLAISVCFVVLCFGGIHLLEFLSFLSRVAGVITGAKVTGYTLQQTTFVATRFIFVAMMPLIGLIVDKKIGNEHYLLMIHASLLCASFFYFVVMVFSGHIVNYFCGVICSFQENGALLPALIRPDKKSQCDSFNIRMFFIALMETGREKGLFYGGAVVFCCYSIGVFFSFYAALNFYEYRSSIGQMSGIVNAMATVLLTFYVEPKISNAIDKDDVRAKEKIYILLLGRLFGVAVGAQALVLILWFI